MCLGVPGRIIEIKEDIAIVDYELEKREGRLISDEFKVGDYVIIQGGIVALKVEEMEALTALTAYKKACS